MRRLYLFISCYLLILINPLQAQNLRGIVADKLSGERIAQATVRIDNQTTLQTDSIGKFQVSLISGSHSITISRAGYSILTQTVRIREEDQITVQYVLERFENTLQSIVISGSRHERLLAREPVSIVSLSPAFIASTNANTLSDVLNRVPGVSVIDGQAVIRGGVGWSYNIGSRVMVLLDDMPMMGADVGDVQWDLLPIEAADHVEVLKGPASVLYGSSASSGTVSVRTIWPSVKPETKIQLYQGITDYPKDAYKAWWDKSSQPFNTGAFFSHRQRFGQFDLVTSGNVDAVRSYNEMSDSYRARAFVKTRYRVKGMPGFSFGLNGSLLYKKSGRVFLWMDSDTNSYRPFDGADAVDYYKIWSLDPHITYTKPGKYTATAKFRHYRIIRYADKADSNSLHRLNDAIANIQGLDLSFQRQWSEHFVTTTGIYLTRLWAVGNIYPDDHTGYSAAAFTQGEYQLGKRISLSAGVRYEINAIGDIRQSPGPLVRGGISYQPARKTFLRLTYGEGFRFPTITERFIQDSVNTVAILPNPNLKNEYGWYLEAGIRQGFRIGQFNATLDVAGFWQEYKNLIQLQFSQWRSDSFRIDYSTGVPVIVIIPGMFGFQAVNMGNTRTAGFEISIDGQGNIGQVGVRTMGGFTYTYPVDLDADPSLKNKLTYLKNLVNAFEGLSTKQYNSILPYRNRKLFKYDIEATYHRFYVGYTALFYGVFEKFDGPWILMVPGIGDFMKNAQPGNWVHNIRVGINLNQQVSMAILVNNILNEEYTIRLAHMEQPRNFSVQARIRFN